jgi:tripeptide aminopeptidase
MPDGFASELAKELAGDVRDRFVRYARIDTQAEPGHDDVPSTAKQLELSKMLVEELNEMGAEDVEIDEHGIVFATIPSTVGHDVPAFGVLAHVDTSFDAPGAGVDPQVVTYAGGKHALPGNPAIALDPAESPELDDHAGHEIVTSDGTTLLGADDKAGVAAIMGAAKHLLAHPDLPHGNVRVGFTTDEEVGHGAKFFDIERFGAVAAYTIDGSRAGDIEDETFSAYGVQVTFHGFSVHPGFAKDRLVNSLKLASDFVGRLPHGDSPETTDGRTGFSHPVAIEGGAEETTVTLIVRDFEMAEVERRIADLRALAEEVVASTPTATVEVTAELQYRNMRDHLDNSPEIVDAAVEAIRRAGLEPRRGYIRGGTDGSVLTAKGLPTPNIFSGAQDFHSVKEWVCVHDMGAAAATIVHLAQVWAERAAGATA